MNPDLAIVREALEKISYKSPANNAQGNLNMARETAALALPALDRVEARLAELELDLRVAAAMDMTATAAQWEGAFKNERARAEAAEARLATVTAERDDALERVRSRHGDVAAACERAEAAYRARDAAEARATRLAEALELADVVAEAYGRMVACDGKFYAYQDARAALAVAPAGQPDDFPPGFEWSDEEQRPVYTGQPESREGMVTVCRDDGRYLGCMGEHVWRGMLEKGPIVDVWPPTGQPERTADPLYDAHCGQCARAKSATPTEHVDGRGPGWKCVCGWWNWLPASEPPGPPHPSLGRDEVGGAFEGEA